MPASRTSSIPPLSRYAPISTPPKIHGKAACDSDVICLSSSDTENTRVPPTIRKQSKHRTATRTKKPPVSVPIDLEIIEISDDDSPTTESPTKPSVIADFRRQINRLREESMKNKRDFERASRELRELKEENLQLQALCKPDNGKITLDSNQVMDQLDCEICSLRMWTPYILPDCGHAFCQPCLHSWFSRTKSEFMAAHPRNPPAQLANAALLSQIVLKLAYQPLYAETRHIIETIQQYMPPEPTYTCPTCREPVTSRPTEVFTLKSLVRTVSAAAGESSPQKKGSSSKGKAPATSNGDPWGIFFPLKRT